VRTFEQLFIRLTLEVRPEDNPSVGLPEPLATRRGITICGPMDAYKQMTQEEILGLELRGGLRALKYRLQQDGYVVDDRPEREAK
jgi:hypothetical protein